MACWTQKRQFVHEPVPTVGRLLQEWTSPSSLRIAFCQLWPGREAQPAQETPLYPIACPLRFQLEPMPSEMIGIPTRTSILDHRPLRVWQSLTIHRLLRAANMFYDACVPKSGASLCLTSRVRDIGHSKTFVPVAFS